MTPRRRIVASVALLFAPLGACGSGDDSADTPESTPTLADADAREGDDHDTDGDQGNRFPDVLAAEARYDAASETWSFEVTMSSPYDTPERYADGWRVVGPDGTVYGVHTLMHDHAAEQPFTRRQSNVEIPGDVDAVTIEGRDQANGFGGDTVTISLQTG